MDAATLLISHYVLSLESVRETARILRRPVASVGTALARLQSQIATPLATTKQSRIFATLEGRRLAQDLRLAADRVLDLAALAKGNESLPLEVRAANLTLPLAALARFMIVVRMGSIRAAASEIGIGQPQLSRQIGKLENELCVDLLERRVMGSTPTPLGKKLFAVAEDLSAIWGRISHQADERFFRSNRTVSLGSIAPLGRESRIAKILALFAAEWPKHQPKTPLFISSTNSEELLAGLESKTYDVGLLESVQVPSGMNHEIIFRSRLVLAGSPSVLSAHNSDIRSLFLEAPIALPSLKIGLRQKHEALIRNILKPEEKSSLTFVEVDSIPVIANLILDHGYVSLLPQWAIQGLKGMESIPLPDTYDIHLLLAWRNEPASQNVAQVLLEILRLNRSFTA